MSKLKALIFDVDGTLSDTERDGHRVAFNRAFEKAGLSTKSSFLNKVLGAAKGVIV